MGANVNIVDTHGITPLHHAAHYDHVSVMKLLLRGRADAYAVTTENMTALEMALRVGNFDAAVTLHLCYRRDGREHDFRMLTSETGGKGAQILFGEDQAPDTGHAGTPRSNG